MVSKFLRMINLYIVPYKTQLLPNEILFGGEKVGNRRLGILDRIRFLLKVSIDFVSRPNFIFLFECVKIRVNIPLNI